MRTAIVVAALLTACGAATEPNAPLSCGERPDMDGACVGESGAQICAAARCDEGARCARVVPVSSDTELQREAAAATDGTCLWLNAGEYSSARIVGGVSLLARSTRDVTLESIFVSHRPGTASLIRGVRVAGGSIRAEGPGSLALDRVIVEGSPDFAVSASEGSLTITSSTIRDSGGRGVSIVCSGECVPGSRPRLALLDTWITNQLLVGVLAARVDVELRHVVIDHIAAKNFQGGRGLEVWDRATLQASHVRVEHTADVGVHVGGSAATLGPGLEVRDAVRGIRLADIPAGGVVLDGFVIEQVSGFGVELASESRGVVLRNGRIRDTRQVSIPLDIGGVVDAGDALAWRAGVHASVESSVTLESSARNPSLLDAKGEGTFAAKLAGGDAQKGIVVEHASGPAGHPALAIAPGTKVVYAP